MKIKVGKQHQILAKDISEQGEFPVVDQGQSFIAGYCDEDERLIDFDLPMVIFGDHTRCFKYVDFPFVLGADGTKVLKPDQKLFDPKFYYFAMLSLDIPSRGYNRHFKYLKEKTIPKPPMEEQKKIAYVLSTVQRAIEQQERIIAATTELKKALMQKLFTEGLRGESQKQTEIGPIPESWALRPFGDVAEFKNGINFTKKQKGSKGILTIDVLNMYGPACSVSMGNLYRVDKSVAKDYLLEKGDLLFVRSSLKLEGVGWTSLYTENSEPTTFCGFIIRARLCNEAPQYSPQYLTYYFRTEVARKSLVSGSAKVGITNINQGTLKSILVPTPLIDEQQEIAAHFTLLDDKIAQITAKKSALSQLFRTLLYELMTANIRVSDISL